MTLNKWEQSNIEVLTSREMGEWLCRRENRLLDKIRAEIANDIHKCSNTDMAFGMQHTLDIIDKYKAESEDKE